MSPLRVISYCDNMPFYCICNRVDYTRYEHYTLYMEQICEYCNSNYNVRWPNQRFCCLTCANRYNAKTKRPLENHSAIVGRATKTNREIKSIYDVSSRTKSKILNRIGLGCCRCGWKESICDLHHIIPRKQGGTDSHDNLVLVCPNCHRMLENGLIDPLTLPSLLEYFPENWHELYYG